MARELRQQMCACAPAHGVLRHQGACADQFGCLKRAGVRLTQQVRQGGLAEPWDHGDASYFAHEDSAASLAFQTVVLTGLTWALAGHLPFHLGYGCVFRGQGMGSVYQQE